MVIGEVTSIIRIE